MNLLRILVASQYAITSRTDYEEYIKQPLPKAMEAALFYHDGHRKKGESLFVYASRKRTLFKDL